MQITAHAVRQVEAKGFSLSLVEAVWRNPEYTYPSARHPGQHKRIGRGLCLCCDDATGRVITVFINQTETDLRADQRSDKAALKWDKGRRR